MSRRHVLNRSRSSGWVKTANVPASMASATSTPTSSGDTAVIISGGK